MTENPDNESETEASPTGDAPRRRGFNPRLAVLTSLGALVVVLGFAVVLAFTGHNSPSPSSKKVESAGTLHLGANDGTFTATTLPDAGLVTMAGDVTDLRTLANGKPTMINMFSSSCTACRTEMPALEKLHHKLGDSAQLLGVDLGDSQSIAAKFVKQTGITYPVVRDPQLLLVNRLDITAQPMTLWVNAQGRIVGHRYGALTPTEMRLALRKHLGEVGS